ncbi:MAG: Thymidylate kinase [Holosporales bacterium]
MFPQFITFEGGEGCGKSTQLRLLSKSLSALGKKVVETREPGGTPGAEEIRHLLVTGSVDRWHPHTEALLMFAARCEHWQRFIKPHMDAGYIVLSDRFADSSYAYQGYARGLDLDGLKKLYDFTVGSNEPNLTFLLDLDPAVGLDRTKKRSLDIDERFEKETLTFHENVRAGYLDLQKKNPNRIILIDANRPKNVIRREILNHIL